jgi:NIPSNAP
VVGTVPGMAGPNMIAGALVAPRKEPGRGSDNKTIDSFDGRSGDRRSASPAQALGENKMQETGKTASRRVYELRTYSLKPGAVGEMLKAAATVEQDIRKNAFGKLEGYWSTDIGPLNQVMHLWSFNDSNERAQLQAELAKDKRWATEYAPLVGPLIVRQEIRLLKGVVGPVAPASTENVYEFRNYRVKTGAVSQWIDAFLAGLPGRERHSKIVGLWHTDTGEPNEVCHIWAFPSLNARAEARNNALNEPEWKEFLATGSPLLEEMHSTIMLPAPHSPLA